MNNQVKRIVCPVDFSDSSELALVNAIKIAEQTGADLQLISVVQPITPAMFSDGMLLTQPDALPNQSEELAKKLLSQWREKFCAPVLERTSLYVAVGTPFAEIVRHARENEADLIVMGSHGRTGIEHLMLGSVAEHVVRKATCSVLVVRETKRTPAAP